ncbi:helix-turn-helix domain-containing protein [Serratia sp. 2723]|uniref:helix-turn-helix domain-containing protein n=1 Tax=unclassified Serratia (in: enterobacteria) TaxID=2647522 RepID=UPI003D2004AC
MFTSRELNTFICVSEKKSIKLAAEELNISSPAVCSMIKKLEGRINSKLFIFEKNEMMLTQYGERIYVLTKSHFHALKSLEKNIKENKKIIKIFISEDISFISSFIINNFKKKSIDIMITNIIDDSVDYVISDMPNISISHDNYETIFSSLNLYLVKDKNTTCKDIFIHKDYSQLLKKNLTSEIIANIEDEINGEFKVKFSDNLTSIVEMLLFSFGFTILHHLCPLLSCLEKSDLEIKKIEKNIPIYIYAHKRTGNEKIELMFEDLTHMKNKLPHTGLLS